MEIVQLLLPCLSGSFSPCNCTHECPDPAMNLRSRRSIDQPTDYRTPMLRRNSYIYIYRRGEQPTLFDLEAIVVVVVVVQGRSGTRRDNRHGSETSIGVLIGLETFNKSRAPFAIIESYLLY